MEYFIYLGDFGVFMEEKVYFKDARGRKLCGILALPKMKDVKFPLVLMSPGFFSHKNSTTYKSIASLLKKKGIVCFSLDYPRRKDSEGLLSDTTVSSDYIAFEAAYKLVFDMKFVDKNRICLLGSSLGGLMSLIGLYNLKGSCGVLFCPIPSWKEKFDDPSYRYHGSTVSEWKKRGYVKRNAGKLGGFVKLKYSFYEDSLKYDGYKLAKKIKTPVLIVHGDKDTSVPLKQSEKLVKNLKNGELVVMNGADHYFSDPKLKKKRHEIAMGWILKHL